MADRCLRPLRQLLTSSKWVGVRAGLNDLRLPSSAHLHVGPHPHGHPHTHPCFPYRLFRNVLFDSVRAPSAQSAVTGRRPVGKPRSCGPVFQFASDLAPSVCSLISFLFFVPRSEAVAPLSRVAACTACAATSEAMEQPRCPLKRYYFGWCLFEPARYSTTIAECPCPFIEGCMGGFLSAWPMFSICCRTRQPFGKLVRHKRSQAVGR